MSKEKLQEQSEYFNYPKLIEVSFESLKRLGGSGRNEEIMAQVIGILQIPENVLKIKHTSRDGSKIYNSTQLDYMLRWCRTYLKLYNAVESPSYSVWVIKKDFMNKDINGNDVYKFGQEMSKKNRLKNSDSKNGAGDNYEDKNDNLDNIIPDESTKADDLLKSNKEETKKQLLSLLDKMNPDKFERLILVLLRDKYNFELSQTSQSHDGGVDLYGTIKALNNLMTIKVVIQCKRYSDKNRVGAKLIREFRGSFDSETHGIFVTRGAFTSEAIEAANQDGMKKITLIDGKELVNLMIENEIGCYKIYKVDDEYFDVFSDE